MNEKIVHEQSSFFSCEFFIQPSFVDVLKVSESIDRCFQICSQGNARVERKLTIERFRMGVD
jgi:hypothetical protein